jgi:replicative DNA helicase
MGKKQYTEADIFKNGSKDKPVVSYDLPHDDTSENGVIGSILLKPSLIGHSESLKPKMFYNEELATLYEIIFDLFNVDGVSKIDDYTIISKIESANQYKKMMRRYSTKELRELFKKLRYVGTEDLNEYIRRCENVMNMDFRRNSHIKLKDLSKEVLYNLDEGMNMINLKVQDEVMRLAEEYLMENSVQTIDEIIDEAFEEIKNRSEDSDAIGFPSKFKTINRFFKYERGELVIIGGRAKRFGSLYRNIQAIIGVLSEKAKAICYANSNRRLKLVRGNA